MNKCTLPVRGWEEWNLFVAETALKMRVAWYDVFDLALANYDRARRRDFARDVIAYVFDGPKEEEAEGE